MGKKQTKNNYLGHARVSVSSSTARLRPFQRRRFSGGDVYTALCTQCEPSIYLKHYTSSSAGGYNGLSHQKPEFSVTFSNGTLGNGRSSTAATWRGKAQHETSHGFMKCFRRNAFPSIWTRPPSKSGLPTRRMLRLLL